MSSAATETTDVLRATLARDGYAFVQGAAMREMLAPYRQLTDERAFTDSWNRLELDHYMADGGRYRRRRYAAYHAPLRGPIVREPHQPHFQTRDYNPLNGGLPRWFEPIEPDVGAGPSMSSILDFSRALFDTLAPNAPGWHIEAHQFRIEARTGEQGRPTPEGLHRDGVDFVLVLLVARRNIARGVTGIHGLDGRTLGHFTLTEPFDAAVVDDARVAHGVTPVEAIDPGEPAYRDVLVVTFKKKAGAE